MLTMQVDIPWNYPVNRFGSDGSSFRATWGILLGWNCLTAKVENARLPKRAPRVGKYLKNCKL
jgi:hypothetical protein